MYFLGKFSDLFLLFYIESPFVHAVGNDIISELSPCQLVKHQTLLSGIDHLSVIQIGRAHV